MLEYVAEKNTVTDVTAFVVSPFVRVAVPCEVASDIPKLVEGLNRLANSELPVSPVLFVLVSIFAIKREYGSCIAIKGEKQQFVVERELQIPVVVIVVGEKFVQIFDLGGEDGDEGKLDKNDQSVKDLILLLFETAHLTSSLGLDDSYTGGNNIHRMLKWDLSIAETKCMLDRSLEPLPWAALPPLKPLPEPAPLFSNCSQFFIRFDGSSPSFSSSFPLSMADRCKICEN